MLATGQILCSRYRITHALAAGGMGGVWAAEHVATGRTVAVKVMWQELAKHPAAVSRFQTEARAAAKLRSRHVVEVIDHDVDQVAGPFIVMELLVGETLAARVARLGRLHPDALEPIIGQVARGLGHAHDAAIVHRDLKPENIILVRDEDGNEIAKIVDFGVAKTSLSSAARLTVDGYLVGTLAYMSPEQALARAVDARSDLWSLGIIAFEAALGQLPYRSDTPVGLAVEICTAELPVPSHIDPSLPDGFDAWFAQATHRDPSRRFQTAAAMAAALRAVCRAEEPTRPHPVLGRGRTLPPKQPDLRYIVMGGDVAVGPVSGALLRRGLEAGRVPREALVWREGWSEWYPAHEILHELPAPSPDTDPPLGRQPGLESLGPRSIIPPSAPPIRRSERSTYRRSEQAFFVTDGGTTVGPVRPSLLLRGIQSRKVPHDAMVWTEGWDRWMPVPNAVALLEGEPAPCSELLDRPGIQSLGPPSHPHHAPDLPSQCAPQHTHEKQDAPPDGYYVTDGNITVGPVRYSLLQRGLACAKLPAGTLVWREGWDSWRLADQFVRCLSPDDDMGVEPLIDAPGLESIGPRSLIPPKAPSTGIPAH